MADRQRVYRLEAIILRRKDFGEADRLLTVFTPNLGKLRLLAKGARKPSSRKSGHVELFSCANLLVAKGRGPDIISQAETLVMFRPLHEDLDKASLAYYVAELLDKFTGEEDENRPLFDVTLDVLERICEMPEPFVALRFYELRLLGYTGYQPQLHFCVVCREPLAPGTNFFHNDLGGVLCAGCAASEHRAAPISLPALKVLRFLQTRPWKECAALRLKPDTAREVESVLGGYVVHILERRLKSVDFIHRLRHERHGA